MQSKEAKIEAGMTNLMKLTKNTFAKANKIATDCVKPNEHNKDIENIYKNLEF